MVLPRWVRNGARQRGLNAARARFTVIEKLLARPTARWVPLVPKIGTLGVGNFAI